MEQHGFFYYLKKILIMKNFKVMRFIRKTRDKMYRETKNKTKEEIRKYYKEKTNWIK